ncbi:MAG: glycosyltransferase family 2 protein [Methylotenera sp.]|uniref:glycosyltransferase family 2 protein n=1 Tax=Methylotenera sp. TaxID=2051956 RepID=UPI002489BBAB|nr:glycosyltransferase family 2 protein [Methylotenera sp.]MDI1310107.1 glycosyltransferase family 2 protein [Methylotenera sp.]
MIVLEIFFWLAIVLISIPVLTFFVQIIMSLMPSRNKSRDAKLTSFTTILIPAHNESTGITETLLSIKSQLTPNIKVLVVADNCNDDTAAVARSHNVEVIERFHETKRGKGFALDYGIKHLANNPPEIVLILDADCVLGESTISTLVHEAILYKRPIQGLYLMHARADSPLKIKIAAFAWAVKNWARPLGFHRLGLPCQLMGSGMAFPWPVISQVNLASGHIVEDMKLGVDLAKLKLAPIFCPKALITSEFPSSAEGIKTQRTRWEHGHIGMIVKEGLPLIRQSIQQANLNMLTLALDMCVPPLALLVLIISSLSAVGILMLILTGQSTPWSWVLLDLLLVATSVILAWAKFGRNIVKFSELLMVPFYVLAKIPLYIKFVFKRQSEWVRSKRDN